jgi:hypothetical protein
VVNQVFNQVPSHHGNLQQSQRRIPLPNLLLNRFLNPLGNPLWSHLFNHLLNLLQSHHRILPRYQLDNQPLFLLPILLLPHLTIQHLHHPITLLLVLLHILLPCLV